MAAPLPDAILHGKDVVLVDVFAPGENGGREGFLFGWWHQARDEKINQIVVAHFTFQKWLPSEVVSVKGPRRCRST